MSERAPYFPKIWGLTVTGEVNEVSLKIGQLDGTVKTLVDQQSALFRKSDGTNAKLDEIAVSVSALATSMQTHLTAHVEADRIKAGRATTLIGVGGIAGGIVTTVIGFFKHST